MKFYSETGEIWRGMLSDISKAKVSIEIEQYSFWDDSEGRIFLKLLEKKHDEGIKIRIVGDGWGSYPLFQSPYVQKLIRKGIEIEVFNPISVIKPSTWFYHMHTKTLIVDKHIGWIGGVGIKAKFSRFKDTMVRMEETDLVTDISKHFETLWRDVLDKNYFNSHSLVKHSEDPVLTINYPSYGRKEIYEQLRDQLQNAKHSIHITTSYFFPDRNFFQLILDKAKQGLDVKFILRGKDDEYLPVRFSTSFFHKALAAGIGIYRYESAILHAKTAVIDNQWATIGSCNLDKLSFYYNMEANISSTKPEFVQEVHQIFLHDIKLCRKIELADWRRRSVFERIVEIVTWPIHAYL